MSGHRPPPPPRHPIRGDREELHLRYLRELYAGDHITLDNLESRVERVLAGGVAVELRAPPREVRA